MQNQMTQLTKKNYEKAVSGFLTFEEAIDFLETEAKIRTLHEKIEKFSNGQELQPVIVAGLLQNHPDLKKIQHRNASGNGCITIPCVF